QWLEAGKGTPIWATSFPLQGHHRVFPCHFYDTSGHPWPARFGSFKGFCGYGCPLGAEDGVEVR
ncbi:MAG: hypothetical protein DCC55_20420, partial [Chloroflexi bacterium]